MTHSPFGDLYPDVLHKIGEDDLLLNGDYLSREKFLQGMDRCGYDMNFTVKFLRQLKVGGIWCLKLSDKQKRKIFKKSGFRFG